MKLHHYNEAYAHMVRRARFADGTPKPLPKPERNFYDKLKTLKSVSKGISPESRIRLLDYFIQEALTKGQLTEEQASGIYNQLREDKDKIRKQIDDFETGNFNDPFRTTREDFSEGTKKYEYSNPLQKNQYVMRTDEEIQAIIDDPKYKDYTRKDFRNEEILTRKETERETLKFKNFGKKKKKPENLENVKRTKIIKDVQGSNISVKGSGQTGKQFSHVYPLIESAKPGTKTTFVIDAKMNRALEGYNKIGQSIAEAQEFLIKTKPDGYKEKIVELNARAKKNVLNAVNDLGKEFKGQIGYFQVDPDTGEFKPKAGNYKMSFAGIEGENKIYKDMTGKERKDFERKISAIEKAKTIPGVTTADKIERPESSKLRDSFKKFGKYAKQIARPVVRLAAPIIPFAGPAIMMSGAYDAAKAAEQGYTSPDELGAAYYLGPEAAKGLDSLKERVRGQIDETEEFVP